MDKFIGKSWIYIPGKIQIGITYTHILVLKIITLFRRQTGRLS